MPSAATAKCGDLQDNGKIVALLVKNANLG